MIDNNNQLIIKTLKNNVLSQNGGNIEDFFQCLII